MSQFKPKYITFDCYGTLTRFRMKDMAQEIFSDRITPEQMPQFIADFAAYRLDEVLGTWQPYQDVIRMAMKRTCSRWGIEYREQDLLVIYNAIPTWGPHKDVPEPLARVADDRGGAGRSGRRSGAVRPPARSGWSPPEHRHRAVRRGRSRRPARWRASGTRPRRRGCARPRPPRADPASRRREAPLLPAAVFRAPRPSRRGRGVRSL